MDENIEEKIESAIKYFQDLDNTTYNENRNFSWNDKDSYITHIETAFNANRELKKYSEDGLTYLKNNGFDIHESLIYNVSQVIVDIMFKASSKDTFEVSSDKVEQALRILIAYKSILPYEKQIPEFRKLMDINEALLLSGK